MKIRTLNISMKHPQSTLIKMLAKDKDLKIERKNTNWIWEDTDITNIFTYPNLTYRRIRCRAYLSRRSMPNYTYLDVEMISATKRPHELSGFIKWIGDEFTLPLLDNKHKHHDLMIKFADDKSIQLQVLRGGWLDIKINEVLREHNEYREKPSIKNTWSMMKNSISGFFIKLILLFLKR